MFSNGDSTAVSPGWADSLQKAQGNLPMFALANEAKILSRLAVEPFEGVLTERHLCAVDTHAGRLEPNDSPRGESIIVTWSPRIYPFGARWRARLLNIGFSPM